MSAYAGRVALVTGSSRGVGRLLAGHFLDGGAQVFGIARGAATLDHARYTHVPADLADPAGIADAFRRIRAATPALDIAVNAAAVLTSQYALIMPDAAAEAMVRVNLLAPFLVAREAAKLMRARKWGRIISVSSMAVRLEPAGDSVYAATKAGLTTLTNILARELAPLNITCNTLGISAIDTDMLRQLPADKVARVVEGLPLPRMATADDLCNVIDFFASPRSGYISAQTLYLGGLS